MKQSTKIYLKKIYEQLGILDLEPYHFSMHQRGMKKELSLSEGGVIKWNTQLSP